MTAVIPCSSIPESKVVSFCLLLSQLGSLLLPPKDPVLSFSEMIAQAAAVLKKSPAGGDAPNKDNPNPIPKKGGADKEESKKEASQLYGLDKFGISFVKPLTLFSSKVQRFQHKDL